MTTAREIRVRGVVQGVGFRPFVFQLARANMLTGWVVNDEAGVEIHVEGRPAALDRFLHSLLTEPPPAAVIDGVDVRAVSASGADEFAIHNSRNGGRPSARISPDLPVCNECLAELFDPTNPRFLYPYINCTNCGPRYSVTLGVPYDRANTTMHAWNLDAYCAEEYGDPTDRRFHAQPVACPACGPHYILKYAGEIVTGDGRAIASAAALLRDGRIVAVKGIGGYHLTCDARNESSVQCLRERKFRKEKPFALMAADLAVAREAVELSREAEAFLTSQARPIVLARSKAEIPGVSPDNADLGLMLPYTPLHHLLFAAGAPELLVMTSANRSNEPIAYEDDQAEEQLAGIADAFLIGERPIARRMDDSIARAGAFGPVILRRARGYAPACVAKIPCSQPILAVGADLKNSVTLVVDGQAMMSQHIGDLDQFESLQAYRATIDDLLSMYGIERDKLIVAYDSHPQYRSSLHACELGAASAYAIQHHRAHIASVLAEHGAWNQRVLGVSFDGTGYGDDGTIWGGEFFAGSVAEGFTRVAHLRPAALVGGDAAARNPVQAAAGFLGQLDHPPDFTSEPFCFPKRYEASRRAACADVRTFTTTSIGRLFDTAAALLGFTGEVTFEGQAAMWVEHLARTAEFEEPYPFPQSEGGLDFRPLLAALVRDRYQGKDPAKCARAFQRGVAHGLFHSVVTLCETNHLGTVVLSGGVFQNELLLEDFKELMAGQQIAIWTNRAVPPNDGGISLGQAALAAFQHAAFLKTAGQLDSHQHEATYA